MEGPVRIMDENKGLYAIETERGGYSVIELFSSTSDIKKGDVISGPLNVTGEHEVENLTSSKKLTVFIEAINYTRSQAIKLMKSK